MIACRDWQWMRRAALALAAAGWSAGLAVAAGPVPGDSPAPVPAAQNAFPATLGSFSTTLLGSLPARTQNIQLALRALDGLVLEPGDVLSFNRAVGPRTLERGYQVAPVILREVRQLQLGGGICQLASTLFVAALVSGLSPVERHRHSSPVDYIPLGQDATISWGAKDLRMRNDLDQRVRLRAEVLGSTLTVRFEGEEGVADSYEIESEVEDAEDAPGGTPGREVDVYRVHRIDGQEVEREFLHRDVYPAAAARPAPPAP